MIVDYMNISIIILYCILYFTHLFCSRSYKYKLNKG